MPVQVCIIFAAPASGSATARLPSGEIVYVDPEAGQGDTRFAHPERYAELQPVLVPPESRALSTYSGYALAIECTRLDSDFDVVAGEPGEHPVSDILDHGRQIFSGEVDDLVRQLAKLIPRYRLWGIVDWHHAPGNDDLADLLRYHISTLTGEPHST